MTPLKKERLSRGISVREASRRARISATLWSRVENAQRLPSFKVAARMASVVGGGVAGFFDWETRDVIVRVLRR
jgi:transcriptional regulator with XRE-family HTH domain